MKKTSKYKKKKSSKRQIVFFFLLFFLFGFVAIILPTIRTDKFSYGAAIPPSVPARPNLQLVLYNPSLTPTLTPTPQQQQQQPPGQPNQPVKTNPPGIPITQTTPDFTALRTTPRPVGPTAPKSNGQPCPGGFDTGKPVTGSCYCTALTVTCKNGVGYGANGALYPGKNPCGSSSAPGNR